MTINLSTVLIAVVLTALIASAPGFYALVRQGQSLPVEYKDMVTAQANNRQRIRELEAMRETDHALITTLQEQMDEMRTIIKALVQQVEEAGMTPVKRLPTALANGDKANELRRFIYEHFNDEEISDLVFELGIEPEDVTGKTRLARSRALVEYAKRNEMIGKLAELVDKKRPKGD